MRYYNENPQVTYLLEKIEEQEKVIKELISIQTQKADEFNVMRTLIFAFNRLPWYKKMFYKFKL